MHFRSRQSDFLVLMFFAKCFPHLTHRGTVCAVPRFFSLGHFVTKLRPSALASGRRQRAQHATTSGRPGAVDKVSLRSALPTKKDALWRHPACFIIRFRFNAVADKRQWSSAASKPRRKTRAKLCSRFCAENEPSHQTCRSFSASRYSGLERRSRLRCRSAAK